MDILFSEANTVAITGVDVVTFSTTSKGSTFFSRFWTVSYQLVLAKLYNTSISEDRLLGCDQTSDTGRQWVICVLDLCVFPVTVFLLRIIDMEASLNETNFNNCNILNQGDALGDQL